MDLTTRLRAWTYERQHLGEPAASAEAALAGVIGVYSGHPTAPLALLARTRGMTRDEYAALDADGCAVRMPAMRHSGFLLPRATAAMLYPTFRFAARDIERRLREFGVDLDDYKAMRPRILAAAKEPVAPKALVAATGLSGLTQGQVLRCLCKEGVLLRVSGASLRADRLKYVATKSWAPEVLKGTKRPDAMAWLAGEYLRAFGPARVKDFAWWCGIGSREAATAFEAHTTVDVGDELMLRAEDERGFDSTTRLRGTVDLLPKWDSYTMGHAPDGRARLVADDVLARVYRESAHGFPGDGKPVVLIDGQVAGLWDTTVKDGVTLELFDTIGTAVRRRLDRKLDEVTALLET
jgi:hypothetical protein